MKSIMEEASSFTKAIEQAWQRAGKPTEFTVKILEEAKRNFLGFTTQSAKIALFFNDQPQRSAGRAHHHQQAQPQSARKPMAQPAQQQIRRPQQEQIQRPLQQQTQPAQPKSEQPQHHWEEDMVVDARMWVEAMLTTAGVAPEQVHTKVAQNRLIISWKKQLAASRSAEHAALSSLAHLLMQHVHIKFKQRARGLRVALNNNL